jgi:hypothetical protein
MLGLVPCTRVSVKHNGVLHVRATLCLGLLKDMDFIIIAVCKHMKFVLARSCVMYEDEY